jgi:hypothetical protein
MQTALRVQAYEPWQIRSQIFIACFVLSHQLAALPPSVDFHYQEAEKDLPYSRAMLHQEDLLLLQMPHRLAVEELLNLENHHTCQCAGKAHSDLAKSTVRLCQDAPRPHFKIWPRQLQNILSFQHSP